MNGFLRAQAAVEPRSDEPRIKRYIRSYLILRILVGLLGVILPLLLLAVDGVLSHGEPFPRDSLSAYYYSAARENFVGTLSAIGIFLITYKVAEKSLDNFLSIVAGVGAMAVAFFPTARRGDAPLTPLQQELGEVTVGTIHFVAAGVFIGALGVLCYQFGRREGRETQPRGNRSPAFWKYYHWTCAGVIAAALAWCLSTYLLDFGPDWAVFAGEWVAAWAFGASWFMKGFERDYLRE